MLPEFQDMMRPVLLALADGREHASADIRHAVAIELRLEGADLAEPAQRSPVPRYVNLIAWALHHLSRACLVERCQPSTYRITERGRRVLVAHPTRVDIDVCRQFDEWHHSRTRRAARAAEKETGPAEAGPGTAGTGAL